MNLLHIFNSFQTKQVLNKNYETHANSFKTKEWWGEYNNKHHLEEIEYVLKLFQTQREKYFTFIRQSDYRDTWKSKNLSTNYFIKEYRVFESKYRKILIYKRNILRRNLAKKGFAINIQLEKIGIPTIENLCYAANINSYISHKAFYISIAEPNSITIEYYFINWLQKKHAYGYKINVVNNFPEYKSDDILFELGKFSKLMLDNGIRLLAKEYLGNILIVPNKDNPTQQFELKLCDPEGIDLILKFSIKEKIFAYIKIRERIEKVLNKLPLIYNIKKFDEGGQFSYDKKFFVE